RKPSGSPTWPVKRSACATILNSETTPPIEALDTAMKRGGDLNGPSPSAVGASLTTPAAIDSLLLVEGATKVPASHLKPAPGPPNGEGRPPMPGGSPRPRAA